MVVPWVVISYIIGDGIVQVVAAGVFMPPSTLPVLWHPIDLCGTSEICENHISHLLCIYFVPAPALMFFMYVIPFSPMGGMHICNLHFIDKKMGAHRG